MNNRVYMNREAIRAALSARRRTGVDFRSPLCVYECAQKLGVDVRFLAAPSLEGMYSSSGGGTVVLSSLRPLGRQAFTCAHELGHHELGHGSCWDEYLGEEATDDQKPEEWAANRFASYLLMPKEAVIDSFERRGWGFNDIDNQKAYAVASELGVGYTALLNQMRWSLNLLSADAATALAKVPPKRIRETLLGRACEHELVLADRHWARKAVDVQVGDVVVLPRGTALRGGATKSEVGPSGCLIACGVRPGVSQAQHDDLGLATFIRVSRREYVGSVNYRHLEEVEDGHQK